MTMMSALPLQISAPPPAAEASTTAGRRGADDASPFPQMLAAQRKAHEAGDPDARTRATRDDAQAASEETLADEAALQLLATLLPGAAAQQVTQQAAEDAPEHPGKPASGAKPALLPAAAATAALAAAPILADAAPNSQAQPQASGNDTVLLAPSAPAPAALDARTAPAVGQPAATGSEGAAKSNESRLAALEALASNSGIRTGDQAVSPKTTEGAATVAAPSSTATMLAAEPALGSLPGATGTPASSQPVPASASPAGASLFVSAPLGHPGWNQVMAQQVGHALQNSANGIQHAELRLDPPDLGPLRVTLQIQDNVAHAWFVSPHASVRQAVESALPHLAQQLADAGLSLGGTHVGSEQAGDQQATQSQARQAAGGNPGSAQVDAALPAASPQTASASSHLLIDTYA